MSYSFIKQFITEGRQSSLSIDALPYGMDDLSPAISKATLEYHYSNLAKTYAKRYNAGEGDPVFNEAGVFLHNILFQQYQESTANNMPTGVILELIEIVVLLLFDVGYTPGINPSSRPNASLA
jgi:hypothetical protein